MERRARRAVNRIGVDMSCVCCLENHGMRKLISMLWFELDVVIYASSLGHAITIVADHCCCSDHVLIVGVVQGYLFLIRRVLILDHNLVYDTPSLRHHNIDLGRIN